MGARVSMHVGAAAVSASVLPVAASSTAEAHVVVPFLRLLRALPSGFDHN